MKMGVFDAWMNIDDDEVKKPAFSTAKNVN